MTAIVVRDDRSPTDVLAMHQCGPGGRCWVCQEPFLCTKARKMLKAYFMHHPRDLPKFCAELARQCATNPAFRHMTAEALHAHFVGWAEAVARQQRTVEVAVFRARQEAARAAHAASTGAQRAIDRAAGNIVGWWRAWRESRDLRLTDGNGRRPMMGQPPRHAVVDEETVSAGRDG